MITHSVLSPSDIRVLFFTAYPHCWSAVGDIKETTVPTITYSQYLAAAKGPGVDPSLLVSTGSSGNKSNRNSASDGEEEDFDPAAGGTTSDSGSSSGDESVAKIQFRQISVGEQESCGITLLGAHLHCWGGRGKNPLRATGPFRQVSVGRRGVCAITAPPDEQGGPEGDQLVCWGLADSLVHHSGDSAAQYRFDQVSVGASGVCAVTMDSELKCWGGGMPAEYANHAAKFIVA